MNAFLSKRLSKVFSSAQPQRLPPVRFNGDSDRRFRVVISGHETCGLIRDLAKEFRGRGFEVVTVALTDTVVPGTYDLEQYSFPRSLCARLAGFDRAWDLGFKALWELRKEWHESLETRLRIVLASSADLYLRVWGNIPFDRRVLRAVAGGKTRIATLLTGSDVRDYDVFRKQFGITRWTFPPEYYAPPFRSKLESLRIHERYADAIFSVPDQMGLALRPYHHLQIPMHLQNYEYFVPGRSIPRVIHAPSVASIKGTDVIETALETLRHEGVPFEYVPMRSVPHEKLLRMLSDADVVIDQLVVHGPGWLGFEAMASGCAVATRYLKSSPGCFRPPVWRIDEEDIVSRLRTLLTDNQLRMRLANEGRRYVENHNQAERVVDELLEKLVLGRAASFDYLPTYLTKDYVPKDDDETNAINAANSYVSGECWYQEYVTGSDHDGIVF